MPKMKIYFDGGTKLSNPGPMITGFVLVSDNGQHEFVRDDYDQVSTNNESEYCGLISGMVKALDLGVTDIQVVGDSNLVIQQASGKWKCKAENLKPLLEEVQRLTKQFKKVEFAWIRRDKNLAGIFLEHGEEKARSHL